MITYEVYNLRTGNLVGSYSTARRARAAADRKDNEHGAYIHLVRETRLRGNNPELTWSGNDES